MDHEVTHEHMLTQLTLHTNTCTLCYTKSDEKWFYGLVTRTFAKACEGLGISKQSFSFQHKSYITKVMTWDCGILF
jgi:hypothetical protein